LAEREVVSLQRQILVDGRRHPSAFLRPVVPDDADGRMARRLADALAIWSQITLATCCQPVDAQWAHLDQSRHDLTTYSHAE
jgi:hypothetical protein